MMVYSLKNNLEASSPNQQLGQPSTHSSAVKIVHDENSMMSTNHNTKASLTGDDFSSPHQQKRSKSLAPTRQELPASKTELNIFHRVLSLLGCFSK